MADHDNQNSGPVACYSMESVNRISKLPVVESTLQTGKNIYDKVKDYNNVTNWTISTAENTVYKAVDMGKPYAAPIVHSLEGPIKKVDGILCTGLDYVEAKLPAVKLPPGELYTSTKDYINSSPTVQTACSVVQPAMETAKNTVQGARGMVEPAIEGAKQMMEPAVQSAKNMVDPFVQSSLEKATAIREYGTNKIEEYLHSHPRENQEDEGVECADCQGDNERH